MKEYFQTTGGRHLYGTDFRNLQELALSMTELFRECGGNFVISGCVSNSYNRNNGTCDFPEGYAYIDGKVRHVEAKSGLPMNNLKIVAKERTFGNLLYDDGSYHPQYTEYYAEYENTDSVDAPYIAADNTSRPPHFPNLGDVFFEHYTVSRNGALTLPRLTLETSVYAEEGHFTNGVKLSNTDIPRIIPHQSSDGGVESIEVEMSDYSMLFSNKDGSVSISKGSKTLVSICPQEFASGGNTIIRNEITGDVHYSDNVYLDKAWLPNTPGAGIYSNLQNMLTPIGCIQIWGGPAESIPSNYLLCDGNAYDKSGKYGDLYHVLGSMYNESYDYKGNKFASPGYFKFRVPDLRGRFVVGYDPSQNEYASIGNTGGEKAHTLAESEMPQHKHDYASPTLKSAYVEDWNGRELSKIHLEDESSSSGVGASIDDDTWFPRKGGDVIFPTLVGVETNSFNYIPTTQENTSNTGGGRPHENRPPFYTLAYIIRAY